MFTCGFPAPGFPTSILCNIHAGKSENKAFFPATSGFPALGLLGKPEKAGNSGYFPLFFNIHAGLVLVGSLEVGNPPERKL